MSFKRLDPEDISISAESIVAPAWSFGGVELKQNLSTGLGFHLDNNQVLANTGDFYYEVYDKVQSNSTRKLQFSITYGHKDGLGAQPYNNSVAGKSATSTIYGQYRNLVFGDEDTDFAFQAQTSNDIYVISIERSLYKEKLFPGTFNLTLTSGSGATAKTLELTDNSNDITTVSFVDAGRIYDIVSGSDGTAASQNIANGYNANGGSYGKFLPDVGIIILNGTALNDTQANGGIEIGTTSDITGVETVNQSRFFDVINDGDSFKLQSEETISSNFVFVRVRNSEFNYSTNPSNITSSGELRHDVMINTPQAYITTVGLYNDNNDLVAVAKLSRPLLKDFTKEALVRIKLDY
jgi:hypothetical protein